MRKVIWKLTAILLIVCLLVGCNFTTRKLNEKIITFAAIEYTRPDVEAMEKLQQTIVSMAEQRQDIHNIVGQINYFFTSYDGFYTNYNLATIHHDSDLTDPYWEEEYAFCSEAAPEVEQLLELLYRGLANGPMRTKLEEEQYFGEGFFEPYTGEPFYDEGYMALEAEETRIEKLYYDLYTQATEVLQSDLEAFYREYGADFAELYIQLIQVRQQLANYCGYPGYPQFAYDMYYYREYTPEQTAVYMEQLAEELKAVYLQSLDDPRWEWGWGRSNKTQAMDYVRQAANAMGGSIQDAFERMEQGGFYKISEDPKMFDGGYEVYLTSYSVPYIFLKTYDMCMDKLALAHEFGHFAHDYTCGGSYASVDVAEVLSQGMEYLSVLYSDGDDRVEDYKIIEGITYLVEDACYTLFEQRAYELEGEELTVENLALLYEQTCRMFGMDWHDPYGFASVHHFYTNPIYMCSYVYSADVALQIYQQEKTERGKGLETYKQCLTSNETYLVQFVKDNGLQSPFKDGRAATIRQTAEALLGY